MAQYKSGYRLVKKQCGWEECGKTKLLPERNEYCSLACANRANARKRAEENAVPVVAPDDSYPTVEEMLEPKRGYATSKPVVLEHPPGWEPQIRIKGDEAEGSSVPFYEEADEAEMIAGWELDPKVWGIVDGTVDCRRWQATVNRGTRNEPDHQTIWLRYYKAKLRKLTSDRPEDKLLDELIEEVRSWSPRERVETSVDPKQQSMMIFIADPQIGKRDGGGAKTTQRRMMETIDRLEDYIRDEIVPLGVRECHFVGMGDLIEQCANNYSTQSFTVELTRRKQINLMRRILLTAIDRLSPYFETFIVSCVGGNHGENRNDGRMFTDYSDNDDVAIFDQLEDILSVNPERFSNIEFRIPDGELALSFDVSGVAVGITHGHLATKGATPEIKQLNWWKNQCHGLTSIGQTLLLFTAHYHHYVEVNDGQKTLFICPALEGDSEWWTNASGQRSYPGVLTAMVGTEAHHTGRGYDRVRIL